jgi:CRP-like cAMP-binding protein
MARREVTAAELLSNSALFRQLDIASRARIAARTTKVRLRRGETVFRRGERPAGFFIVIFGEIMLIAHGARGPRQSGMVGPGRSFGEPVMFLDRAYIVDARAQTDALVLHVPKDAVFAEIDANPVFARRMIAGLAARVEALVGEIDALTGGTAQERLVDYLLRSSRVREGPATVTLPTSKAALASRLGLTPEHLSRILHDLARRTLLRIDGRRIAIPDTRALAAHSGRSRPGRRTTRAPAHERLRRPKP